MDGLHPVWSLGDRRHVDPETKETQLVLDEAFENIVVLEPPPPDQDDDWMQGEFDTS
jgi:hypothetical protein